MLGAGFRGGGAWAMRLNWVTWLIVYATAARLGSDLVRFAALARMAALAKASLVPDPVVHLGAHVSRPQMLALQFLFTNASQTLLYVGTAAIIEILFRIWMRLRLENISLGAVA
jgi:hypothetical protein